MPCIERNPISIAAHNRATTLLHLLVPIVASLAQALERSCPELVHVTAVRLNVVDDVSGSDFPLLRADGAKRLEG